MIPKKIFQTYKTDYNDLSEIQKAMTKTWIDKNPGYDYRYYSDQDIEKFILRHYGQEWHELFVTVKYPVMKADIFRILILYKYGGFYADLDTECVVPLDSVVNDSDTAVISTWAHYEMCHWFFGFEAGHPLLENAVTSLKISIDHSNYERYYDTEYSKHMTPDYIPHGHKIQNQIYRYVQDVTGPMWWTAEVRKYLRLDMPDLLDIEKELLWPETKEYMLSKKIKILKRENVQENGNVISHKFASDQPVFGDQYESWSQAY
jgi:mannosyltransferase OCH1-like enzyme